ncbi:Uma2 family endonuclease [candidate division KSB1 bacterium]|nr:Uma2 family endonuclease [candidate division KSB1 bacterium]
MSDVFTAFPEKTTRDPLTYKHYLAFPNDGIKKEIIEGDLCMSPAPSLKHQTILKRLAHLLDDYVHQKQLCEIFIAPCDVILSDINVVQPDIVFISRENYSILNELNVQGAPDVVFEISSPSSRETDLIFKKRIYERFGVKEYWIVDPEAEAIEIFQNKENQFQLLAKAVPQQPLVSQLIEGLELDLAAIFSGQATA